MAPTPRVTVWAIWRASGALGKMGLPGRPHLLRSVAAIGSVPLPAAHESHESNFFPHPHYLRGILKPLSKASRRGPEVGPRSHPLFLPDG